MPIEIRVPKDFSGIVTVRVCRDGDPRSNTPTGVLADRWDQRAPRMGQPLPQRLDPRNVLGVITPVSLSIGEALQAWDKYLAGKSRRESTRQQYLQLWNRLRDELGWVSIEQINKRQAQEWLAAQRQEAGGSWSGNTHDHAAVALRSFGAYLETSELVERNPLARLESCGDADGEGARALTTDEAQRFLQTALSRCVNNRKAKGNRPLYWLCLFYLGMRFGEPARLRVGDLRLADDPPGVCVQPKRQKNKKRQWVPLRSDLRDALNEWVNQQRLGPDDPVFAVKPINQSWHEDREAAGIPYEDEHGLRATTHSARKWLATTLDEAGATAAERHKILRHADGTPDRYAKPDMHRLREKIEALPALIPKDLRVSIANSRVVVESLACKTPKIGYRVRAAPMIATPSNAIQPDSRFDRRSSGAARQIPSSERRSGSVASEGGPPGAPADGGASFGGQGSFHHPMPISRCNESGVVRIPTPPLHQDNPARLALVERILSMNEACLRMLHQEHVDGPT